MATSSSQTLALQRNSWEQNRFMEKLMTKIFNFYDEQSMIDVTFKVSNPTALVPAHRLILAAASPYFENLFNGNQGTNPVIEINDIDSDTFEHLITFCYTGQALITVNNVAAMLNAAIVLKLDDAITSSVDYLMTHINEYTLQGAYRLERETQCEVLRQKIIEYETQHFMEISRSDEFLNFDVEKLQRILVSDNLNISREEDAFDAIQRWYNHDVPARQEQLPLLIACLRLTLSNVNFLMTQILPLPGCELLALRALSWIGVPTARPHINQISATNCDEKTILALCSTLNPKLLQYNKTEDKWQEYASIKIDYELYRTILKDDNLLFVGGCKRSATLNVVRSWNIRNKTWQNLPAMIEARRSYCVVELNDKIYAIGGYGDNVLSSVERYSISDGWKFVNSLIDTRYCARAVTLNGKIYIMGGFNGKSQSLKSVECYNPDSNTWTSCAEMTGSYYLPCVAAHKGHIYVLSRSGAERYDPQQNTWSQICSLEVGLGWMTCLSLDNKLWAIGGKSRVSVFDEENFCWVERCSLPRSDVRNCFVVPESLLSSM